MFALRPVDPSLRLPANPTSASQVVSPGSSLASPTPTVLHSSALADIAGGLARTAGTWGTRLAAHRRQRAALRLLETPEYDVWLLYWPPGTSVAPHDHGQSAGAFAVAAGELQEIRWHDEIRRRARIRSGESVTMEREVVHDVMAGDTHALSVHVYSPPLTAMSYYDDHGRRLVETPANAESFVGNLPLFEEQTDRVALSTAAADLPPGRPAANLFWSAGCSGASAILPPVDDARPGVRQPPPAAGSVRGLIPKGTKPTNDIYNRCRIREHRLHKLRRRRDQARYRHRRPGRLWAEAPVGLIIFSCRLRWRQTARRVRP